MSGEKGVRPQADSVRVVRDGAIGPDCLGGAPDASRGVAGHDVHASAARGERPEVEAWQAAPSPRYSEEPSTVPCNRCGGIVYEFSIRNEVWNALVRRGKPECAEVQEYLCIGCFADVSHATLLAALDELDALKSENARLQAGLESIKARGTTEDLDYGTMFSPDAAQAAIVLQGSTRPLERYTEQIATLRAELADLRERAGRLHKAARDYFVEWDEHYDRHECICCRVRSRHAADVVHAPDCPAAPGFLDAKEGGR